MNIFNISNFGSMQAFCLENELPEIIQDFWDRILLKQLLSQSF